MLHFAPLGVVPDAGAASDGHRQRLQTAAPWVARFFFKAEIPSGQP